MIELQRINKSYNTDTTNLHVLKDLSLTVAAGEMVSLMGSSGSGKSTLLNILGILDSYDSGEYHLDGRLIRDMSEHTAALYRSKTIGFVFQSFNLIGFKTAAENVALPLYYQGVSFKKRHKMALDSLERFGLLDWAEHLPSQMSGGQNQRVAIARALVTKPRIILADEPTGALDSENSNDIIAVLNEINKEGITVVIVTHEEDIAEQTKRCVRIQDGKIISDSAVSK